MEWSGLNLQLDIPPWLEKSFRFTVFILLENAIVKLSPWHELIIIPPCRTTPL